MVHGNWFPDLPCIHLIFADAVSCYYNHELVIIYFHKNTEKIGGVKWVLMGAIFMSTGPPPFSNMIINEQMAQP